MNILGYDMTIYEIYFTLIACWFVLRGAIAFVHPHACKRFGFSRDRYSLHVRLFGSTTAWTWRYFYLSLLWLLVICIDASLADIYDTIVGSR